MISPKKIITFFLCLFYFSLSFEKVNFFGLDIDYLVSKVTFVFLIIASILDYKKFLNPRPFKKFIIPLSAYFIYLTIANYLNKNYLASELFDIPLLINIIVFLLVLNVHRFNSMILLIAVLSFSIGNILLTLLYFFGFSNSGFGGRQTVLGINQNALGMMLVVTSFTILFLYQKRKVINFKYIKILLLFLPLLFVLIIRSGSRTAFISFILSFFIFLFFSNLNKIKKTGIYIVSFFISLFVWVFYLKDSLMTSRLVDTIGSGDLSNRDIIWKKIFEILKGNYMFGIGKTGYIYEMTGLFSIDGGSTSPHNVIIEIISYTGFVGLFIIFPFFYHIFKNGFFARKINDNYLSLIYLILILALILSGQLLDQKFAWLLLAYTAGSYRVNREKKYYE